MPRQQDTTDSAVVDTDLDPDPEATGDQEATSQETAPVPTAPPVRVRVIGTGSNTGSVLVCDLIHRTGSVAVVQVLGREVRFGVTDGQPTRVPKAWGQGGWRLDIESLPPVVEPTAAEMVSMRPRDLSNEQLQQVYGHLSGRETTSTTRSYLLWMIAQARAGTLPTGSGRRARGTGEACKVIPVAMAVSVVEALDLAWRRLGFGSRIAFIRQAMASLLREKGEDDVAGMLSE